MLKKYLPLMIMTLLTICSFSTFAVAQNTKEDKRTEKVRRSVTKLSGKTKVQVYVKLKDGTKLKGNLSGVTDDRFSVTDKKSQVTTSVEYQQVKTFRRTDFTPLQIAAFIIAAPVLVVAAYVFIARPF